MCSLKSLYKHFFLSFLQTDIGQLHSTLLPNQYHDVISGRGRERTETGCLKP